MLAGNNLASSKSFRLFCSIIFCKTSIYLFPVSAYLSKNLDKKLKTYTDANLILQVHDEVIVECDKNNKDEIRELIVTTMANAAKLKVPLKVDIGEGINWLEAH